VYGIAVGNKSRQMFNRKDCNTHLSLSFDGVPTLYHVGQDVQVFFSGS
jgi:hypothetical protein